MPGISIRRSLLFQACLIMLACPAPDWAWAQQAAVLHGTVMRVIDGDTLVVRLPGDPIRVRLHAVDAPEMNQPGGLEAKRALLDMVHNRTVQLRPVKQDRYERLVAVVYRDALEINQEMVRQGHAWAYRRYMSRSAPGYCAYEAQARDAGRGLWATAHRGANSLPQAPKPGKQSAPQGAHRSSAAVMADGDAFGDALPAHVAPWEWRRRKTLARLTDYSQESAAGCVAAIGARR